MTGCEFSWSMPSDELLLIPGASSLWLATSVSTLLGDALVLHFFVEEVQAVGVDANDSTPWAVGEDDSSGDPISDCSAAHCVALCHVSDGEKFAHCAISISVFEPDLRAHGR